ncbi:MAG: hypothetical protein H7Y43_08355 [Akkermansiaceae bacterium]|nr:hypothetical protein [Verrucomicrobiales bacterium]
MKSNLLKNVLDWVLATGVLLSLIFSAQFYFRTKELRTLNLTVQAQMAQFQNTRQILNLLASETAEYNKAHPDANLTRILEGVRPAAAPAAKPAGK